MDKKYLHIAALLLGGLVMTSCHLRPLVDPEDTVRVEVTIDTDHISNVTCDFYNPNITYPTITTDNVRCFLYDPSTGKMLNQGFLEDKTHNEKGQEVLSGLMHVTPGNYHIISYNFDVANTLITNEASYNDALAYTSEVPSAIKSHFSSAMNRYDELDIRIQYDPDHLMVSRDPDYSVAAHTGEYVIRTTAKTIIDTYYLQLHLKNGKFVNSVSAVIDGLSPENHYTKDIRNTTDPSAVFFDLQVSKDSHYPEGEDEVLCGVFSTFGKIEDISSDLYITLNVMSTTGEVFQKTISMDKVFKTEDAIERHWLLLDDEIVIPEPDPSRKSGGFEPVVEDWEAEYEVITL